MVYKKQKDNFHGFDGDPTDFAANKGYVIEFYHIATGRTVKFKALLTNFTDNYDSQWSEEDVYGRMDPIKTFKSTKRTISLGWDVVAGSKEEAINNMANCSELFQMLYPTYDSTGSSSTLQAPPLFKLKFLNFIQDVSRAGAPGTNSTAKEAGLVGSVNGFKYAPKLEDGFFGEEQGTIYPQSLNLECEFSCMHTHPLGYDDKGELRNKKGNFPYNVTRTGPVPKETPKTTGAPAPAPPTKAATPTAKAAKTRDKQKKVKRLTRPARRSGFGITYNEK